LAAFLKLVESGKVPHDSFLVLENLDRLSREEEVSACHLLTGILVASVRVVQLKPSELILTEKSNGFDIMRAVMELSRGHGESAMKSERIGKAWETKRSDVRENGKLLTRSLPPWIEVRDGKLYAIPAKALAVKRVFALSAHGFGSSRIVTQLEKEKIPPLQETVVSSMYGPREGSWLASYVKALLNDCSVLGKLQMYDHGSPSGEPVKDYFPPS
jgi:DNA invertase Pin-like site-specific DNA recombinase